MSAAARSGRPATAASRAKTADSCRPSATTAESFLPSSTTADSAPPAHDADTANVTAPSTQLKDDARTIVHFTPAMPGQSEVAARALLNLNQVVSKPTLSDALRTIEQRIFGDVESDNLAVVSRCKRLELELGMDETPHLGLPQRIIDIVSQADSHGF